MDSGNAYLATEARSLLVFDDAVMIKDGLLCFSTIVAIKTLINSVVGIRLDKLMKHLDSKRRAAYIDEDWETYQRIAVECS